MNRYKLNCCKFTDALKVAMMLLPMDGSESSDFIKNILMSNMNKKCLSKDERRSYEGE